MLKKQLENARLAVWWGGTQQEMPSSSAELVACSKYSSTCQSPALSSAPLGDCLALAQSSDQDTRSKEFWTDTTSTRGHNWPLRNFEEWLKVRYVGTGRFLSSEKCSWSHPSDSQSFHPFVPQYLLKNKGILKGCQRMLKKSNVKCSSTLENWKAALSVLSLFVLCLLFCFDVFGGTGVWTQYLTLARQALSHLSHISSLFVFFYYSLFFS
jgi:hypothetical protein